MSVAFPAVATDPSAIAAPKRPRRIAGAFSAALFASTVLAAMTPDSAWAVDECGAIPGGPNSTVNCSGNFANGIEYEPAAGNEVFTVEVGDGTIGGAASIIAPDVNIIFVGPVGQVGVGIANFNGAGTLVTGAIPASSVLNINEFSNVSGGAVGGLVYTDGTGNDAVINNSGTVLATGSGASQLLGTLDGDGLVAISGAPGGPTGSGNATVNNTADGDVNAFRHGLVAYSTAGTATVTNAGEVTTQNGDGMSTALTVLGVETPTTNAAFGTNSGDILAGDDGMVIVSISGVATASNTVDGTIDASDQGIIAYSVTNNAIATNDGEVVAGNDGISTYDHLTNLVATGGTATATNNGSLTAGDDGMDIGAFGNAEAINSATGVIDATDNGIAVLSATGSATGTNAGDVNATNGTGITVTSVLGTATANNSGTVDSTNGDGIFATGATGVTIAGGTGTVTALAGGGMLGLILPGGTGDVEVTGGTTTAADYGVIGVNLGDGNTTVTSEGKTSVASGGLTAGVGGFSLNGTSTVNVNADIDPPLIGAFSIAAGDADLNVADGVTVEADGIGLLAFSFAGGQADIEAGGPGTTVDSAGIGVLAGSLGGDVYVDTNIVNAGASGILAFATGGGNVDIDTAGPTTADGLAAIGAATFGGGDITIDLMSQTVTNTDQIGVLAFADDGGNIGILGEGSTINADNEGIFAIADDGGNVTIDSGTVTSQQSSGVLGIANDGGNVTIVAHGKTTADNGAFGVAGISSDGTASVTVNADIDPPAIGAAAIAFGDADLTVLSGVTVDADTVGLLALSVVGEADIEAEGSIVNSGGVGVVGASVLGDVWIDTGEVNAAGGSGILGGSLAGNVDIDSHGNVTANGFAGISGATFGGNVTIELDPTTSVTNTGGTGIFAIAGGDVDIEAQDTTINADDSGILAYGTNVRIDSNVINATNGSGVIGVGFGGDVEIDTHGKITADDGVFGAFGLSFGGNSTVTVGGDIDPPLFGMVAGTVGAGAAVGNVLPAVNVAGDWVGAIVANIGSGSATLNNEGTIEGGILGVGGLKIGPGGNLVINNIGSDSEILSDETAIGIVAIDPGAGTNNAVINNEGHIIGNSTIGAPVIGALTDGGLTINNNPQGFIGHQDGFDDLPGGFEELAILSLGGDDAATVINNAYDITGRVILLTGGNVGNTFNNLDLPDFGIWETAGQNILGVDGDDTLNNIEDAVIEAGDPQVDGTVTTFEFGGGNDTVNNSGLIDAAGGVGNTVAFLELETFNNYIGADGGLLSMTDGSDTLDVVFIDGFYDGGPLSGVVAVDAFLDLGGDADELYIDGGATGFTDVEVLDLNPGFAAAYDPVGFLVVDVDGGVDGQQNFVLAGGPIDKGFFDYDLFFVPEETMVALTDDRWYLRNTVNERAFELPKMISGAQEVWHQSAHTWLERTADLRTYQFQDAAENAAVSPGLWVRGFGAWLDRDASNTLETASGPVEADTSYSQDVYGVQVGADFAVMDRSNPYGVLLLGVTGGYTWSNMDFDTTGSEADINGFNVGGYATYMYQGFFADLLVKADFHDVDYDTNFDAPDNGSSFDAFSIGPVLDAGYRFGVKNGTEGWFLEPGATLAYVHTSFDGTEMLNSDIDFDDADSLRGRLGARGGWTFLTGDRRTAIEPFVEASAWHEFLGDNAATLSSAAGSIEVDDDVGGTWGEIGGGVNVIDLGSGVSGFVKGEYIFGNDQDGAQVQGGLRINF